MISLCASSSPSTIYSFYHSLSLFLQPYTERQAKHWWRVISVNHMIQISPSCGETYMNIRVTVLDNFPYGFLKFQRNFKSGPGKRIVPLSNLNSPGIYLGRVFHFRFSLVGLFFFFFLSIFYMAQWAKPSAMAAMSNGQRAPSCFVQFM